jgi:hypothetical protein
MFAELGIVFPAGPAAVETAIARGASIVVGGDPPVALAAPPLARRDRRGPHDLGPRLVMYVPGT